jgi:hypothetical protein
MGEATGEERGENGARGKLIGCIGPEAIGGREDGEPSAPRWHPAEFPPAIRKKSRRV